MSTKQRPHEIGISKTSIQHILKRAKWKVYILYVMNKNDPDQRMQFCEWSQHTAHEDEEFMSKTVWSDEATI
jgi:hypothetical protein